MMKYYVALFMTALFLTNGVSAIAQDNQKPMTNSDVVQMVQSGMSEIAIISAINAAIPDFDLTDESVIALSRQKVPDRVISAMVRRQFQFPKAQPQSHQNRASSREFGSKWEIEFHCGRTNSHETGYSAQPPDAEDYSLYGSGAKGYTSKRVSSWYFGSGAELFGLSSTLDSVLNKPILETPGRMFGFRASRAVTKWLAAEFTLDRSSRLGITDDALAQLEAARSSFKKAWSRIDVPGNVPSTSASTITSNGGRQLFATGAAVLSVPVSRRVSLFGTAGAGVLSTRDSMPEANLTGTYGGPNALETDNVRLSFTQSQTRAFTTVVGGGAKVLLTSHFGIRFDIRAYLYNNPYNTVLDANHTNTPDTAWVIGATGGDSIPFIQKLTGPGLAAYSTLSGPAISGLKTFSGIGSQRQIPMTLGFFWRF